MAGLTSITPSAHYGFQSFATDYWLGINDTTATLATAPYQWRLVSCSSGPYYIQDWTSYNCLFANPEGSLGTHPCTSSDAAWTIQYNDGQDSGNGYVFGLGQPARYISADNEGVLGLQTGTPTGQPNFGWSLYEVDESQWVTGSGTPLDLCSSTTTTSSASATTTDAPVTVNDYIASGNSTIVTARSTTNFSTTAPASTTTNSASSMTAVPASQTTMPLNAAPTLRSSRIGLALVAMSLCALL